MWYVSSSRAGSSNSSFCVFIIESDGTRGTLLAGHFSRVAKRRRDDPVRTLAVVALVRPVVRRGVL